MKKQIISAQYDQNCNRIYDHFQFDWCNRLIIFRQSLLFSILRNYFNGHSTYVTVLLRKICQIFQKKNGEQKGLSEKLLICNPVPKADQIFTVLIKKFMVDRKTDELCKLGKQILQLVNQATKEKDQKSIKTALDFWKESTVKLENFDCQLPEARPCSFIKF